MEVGKISLVLVLNGTWRREMMPVYMASCQSETELKIKLSLPNQNFLQPNGYQKRQI